MGANPLGAPLIFVAPRQSTFQLERMVLEQPTPRSFSRLHILSFARLAQFIFEQLGLQPPDLLAEEGRVMVLRSLLARHGHELRIFKASARRGGFAQELSEMLREFQASRIEPESIQRVSLRQKGDRLGDKLHDLAHLLGLYERWLKREGLADADTLFIAASRLLQTTDLGLSIEHVWLDGFATLHAHETRLLSEVLTRSAGATLAFCCTEASAPHLELVRQTKERVWQTCESINGAELLQAEIKRECVGSRFCKSASLAHLEQCWWSQSVWAGDSPNVDLVRAMNPEEEVVHAARTVLKYVQAGGRFREVGLMVRQLEEWQEPVRRIFARYGIPSFIDGRQPVTHHPLAELTRGAVATVVFGWHHEDVMRTLKSGLTPLSTPELDWLENECLGKWGDSALWKPDWTRPEHLEVTLFQRLVSLREKVLAPLEMLAVVLRTPRSNGVQFADAIEQLWLGFDVEETLKKWGKEARSGEAERHQGVLDQCRAWLGGIRTAFGHTELSSAEWIPIMDSGLSALSVGLIPPVLDQVVVGAVDRTRNPELLLTIILGLNEQVFPRIAEAPLLLSEPERLRLESDGLSLPSAQTHRLANEQFLSYIAFTRSSKHIVAVWSQHDLSGTPINPSSIVRRLQRIFPMVEVGQSDLPQALQPETALIPEELFDGYLGDESFARWLGSNVPPVLEPNPGETLRPDVAARLYGKSLVTSPSRFEDFGRCPFRFFSSQGLRAKEREKFELGVREQGSLMHEVLAGFHLEIAKQNRRWRDLSPTEASELMGTVVDRVGPKFEMGVATSSARNRFLVGLHKTRLQVLAATLVDWMRFYLLDPQHVEARFGDGGVYPQLNLKIDEAHQLSFVGKIDRIDLFPPTEGGPNAFTIIDYKTNVQPFKRILVANGLQIQMLVYMKAVQDSQPEALSCAGVFYIGMGKGERRKPVKRSEFERETPIARTGEDHRMEGLFRLEDRLILDANPGVSNGVHLKGRINNDGNPAKNSFNALGDFEFRNVLLQFEANAVEAGRSIYSGDAAIRPYRLLKETGCKNCFYAGVCRIDLWTHRNYRELL